MILFVNTRIAEGEARHIDYDTDVLRDPVQVFKYSLMSHSVVPWSKALFFYELGESYANRHEEVDDTIYEHFPSAEIDHDIKSALSGWQEIITTIARSISDPLVWFLGDCDQILLHYDRGFIARMGARVMELEEKYGFAAFDFTDWPLVCRQLYSDRLLDDREDHFVYANHKPKSAQLMTLKTLEHIFCKRNYGNLEVPRLDESVPIVVPETATVVPKKEVARSFYGYGHLGVDTNLCPYLTIPEGFWDKDIRILYCGEERRPGWSLVHPMAHNYAVVEPDGADLRCMIHEVPTFWKNRVLGVETGSSIPEEDLETARDNVVVDALRGFCEIPKDRLARDFSACLLNPRGLSFFPADGVTTKDKTFIRICKEDARPGSVLHSVILADFNGSLEPNIAMARALLGVRDVQILWMNTRDCDHSFLGNQEYVQYVDWVVHFHFQGAISKHLMFNEALLRCRGSIVTVVEISHRDFQFKQDFLPRVQHAFFDPRSKSLRSKVLHHRIAEVQGIEEEEQKKINLANLIEFRAYSFLWQDAISGGGYDEDVRFHDFRGGAFELPLRLARTGVQLQTTKEIGPYFLALPFRQEVMPASSLIAARYESDPALISSPLPSIENPDVRALRLNNMPDIEERRGIPNPPENLGVDKEAAGEAVIETT